MSLNSRKNLFYLLWFLVLTSPFITVFKNTEITKVFSNDLILLNVIQRIAGLLAFTLISIQIVIGLFMEKWVQVVGSKAYRVHIVQGILTYGLVLFHPMMEMAIVYNLTQNFLNSLAVILPRFDSQREVYLVYGKTALLLMTFAVTAAYFRTKPFFRQNWKKFHILNYFVFYSVFLHMRVGTDITTAPFVWVSWAALFFVTWGLIYKYLLKGFFSIKNRLNADINKQKA